MSTTPTPKRSLTFALASQEIHLWYVVPEDVQGGDLLKAYCQLLSPAESMKSTRFHFLKDRHQYLVTRALVRSVLSHYFPVPPIGWDFASNRYGHPSIAAPRDLPPVRFSISHTIGMILCAVSLSYDVGVDVEDTERNTRPFYLAARHFSPREVHDLLALTASNQRARFFKYWTLKESYVKARGIGLSLPLDQFSFDLSNSRTIRVSFEPRMDDHAGAWQFRLYRPTRRHQVALAIRCRAADELTIRIRRTIPLAWTGDEEGWHGDEEPDVAISSAIRGR